MAENIYIILPVHNRRETTRRFVNCLKNQTYSRFHLLLIDDGSTDGTADMVREAIPSLTLITGKGRWWWAGSLQQAYRWLRKNRLPLSDIVLMINDDTEFEPDFLESAVSVLRDKTGALLLAQCLSRQDGHLIDAGIHVNWKRFAFEQLSPNHPVNCMSTRGLFLRIEDFYTIGGFYPLLLPHYLSDYEFTIRAHRKGMKLTTDSRVRLWLDESTTGYRSVEVNSAFSSVKQVFSKRSAVNPLAYVAFIALACPWPLKFACWLRILSLSVSNCWKLIVGRSSVIGL